MFGGQGCRVPPGRRTGLGRPALWMVGHSSLAAEASSIPLQRLQFNQCKPDVVRSAALGAYSSE